LEAIARDSRLLERIKTLPAESSSQALGLREAGVRLYNTCTRGPGNDVALLKLRLLACEALRGPQGIAANAREEEDAKAKLLDVMRSFSKTGLLLMGVCESELAISAFETCLGVIPASQILPSIQRVHGNAQEAHDCGNAYFGALCGLVELYFEAMASSPRTGDNSRQALVAKTLGVLTANTSFIGLVRRNNQQVLRAILESGISRLELAESLQFQKWMFDEWENFSSSTPGLQQALAARLAFALAKTNDTPGSQAAMERAETTPNLSLEESKANSVFMCLARCAVANGSLRNESNLARLLGSSAPQAPLTLQRQACTSCFLALVSDFSFSTCSAENRGLVFACAADLVASVAASGGGNGEEEVVEHSYGKLLELCFSNVEQVCDVLQHALEQQQGRRWICSSIAGAEAMSLVAASESCRRAKTRLARALWNQVCVSQRESDWDAVLAGTRHVQQMSQGNPEMLSRCLQASLMASMRLLLPDKDGDAAKELNVLQRCRADATRSGELTKDGFRQTLAAVLELKCLVRIATLDGDKAAESVRVACRAHLEKLSVSAVLQIASEAENVNAPECALAVLGLARDRLLRGRGLEGLALLSQRIVHLRTRSTPHTATTSSSEAHNLAQDVGLYADFAKQFALTDEDVEFKRWGKQVLLECCAARQATQASSMHEALATAALLRATSKLCDGSSEGEDLLCACAGELVLTAVAHVQTRAARSAPGNRQLVALCGEQANAAFTEISPSRKQADRRVGTSMLLATLLMSCGVDHTGDVDELVAERTRATCESGEVPFPNQVEMHQVSNVARKLGLFRTARELSLRIVALEFREQEPDYDQIANCIAGMIQGSDAKRAGEIRDWMEQLETLRSQNHLSAPTLHRCALRCWGKQSLMGSNPDLVRMAHGWLEGTDFPELKAMQQMMERNSPPPVVVVPPREEPPDDDDDDNNNNQEDDRDTLDDELFVQEERSDIDVVEHK
ncbi:hypothetical protein BASA82_000440, partial [Batrachochytrium salamandrivorans]